MLALMERYLDRIGKIRTEADAIGILHDVSASLGFRSGFLIEYESDLKSAIQILDSNGERGDWWHDYFVSGLRGDVADIKAWMEHGGVQVKDPNRDSGNEPMLEFARKADLLELVVVPVSFNGIIIGIGGFSGRPLLTDQQKTALQLITYSLIAQTRSLRNVGVRAPTDSLTPREKEVITLSADGLTSQEIALQLGMSPRTVNQHVDNVADKLGTRNRAHTVAEVIRHGLLN